MAEIEVRRARAGERWLRWDAQFDGWRPREGRLVTEQPGNVILNVYVDGELAGSSRMVVHQWEKLIRSPEYTRGSGPLYAPERPGEPGIAYQSMFILEQFRRTGLVEQLRAYMVNLGLPAWADFHDPDWGRKRLSMSPPRDDPSALYPTLKRRLETVRGAPTSAELRFSATYEAPLNPEMGMSAQVHARRAASELARGVRDRARGADCLLDLDPPAADAFPAEGRMRIRLAGNASVRDRDRLIDLARMKQLLERLDPAVPPVEDAFGLVVPSAPYGQVSLRTIEVVQEHA